MKKIFRLDSIEPTIFDDGLSFLITNLYPLDRSYGQDRFLLRTYLQVFSWIYYSIPSLQYAVYLSIHPYPETNSPTILLWI